MVRDQDLLLEFVWLWSLTMDFITGLFIDIINDYSGDKNWGGLGYVQGNR